MIKDEDRDGCEIKQRIERRSEYLDELGIQVSFETPSEISTRSSKFRVHTHKHTRKLKPTSRTTTPSIP